MLKKNENKKNLYKEIPRFFIQGMICTGIFYEDLSVNLKFRKVTSSFSVHSSVSPEHLPEM